MLDLNVNNNRSGTKNVYTFFFFCSIFIYFKLKIDDGMKDFNFCGYTEKKKSKGKYNEILITIK